MKHPFLCLSAEVRAWLFKVTLWITLIGMLALGFADPGRVTGRGPSIVGFELAGSASKATAILEAWSESGTKIAAFNLGFDYLFIVGYSTFMSLGCLWAMNRYLDVRLVALGVSLAWLPLGAGLLDCIENAALLSIVFGGALEGSADVARWSATGKFGLLGSGAVYILTSLPGVRKVREAP
jgi:hypothetical protein